MLEKGAAFSSLEELDRVDQEILFKSLITHADALSSMQCYTLGTKNLIYVVLVKKKNIISYNHIQIHQQNTIRGCIIEK